MVSYYDNRLQFNDFQYQEIKKEEDDIIFTEYIYFQFCLFINRDDGSIGLDTRLHIECGDEVHTTEGKFISAWWDNFIMFKEKFCNA